MLYLLHLIHLRLPRFTLATHNFIFVDIRHFNFVTFKSNLNFALASTRPQFASSRYYILIRVCFSFVYFFISIVMIACSNFFMRFILLFCYVLCAIFNSIYFWRTLHHYVRICVITLNFAPSRCNSRTCVINCTFILFHHPSNYFHNENKTSIIIECNL